MFYFLTHMISDKLPGLELAMINRLKIFKYNKQPAKIVTFQYNRFQHLNTKKYEINDNDFINLFDYFQNAISIDSNMFSDNHISKILNKINHTYPDNELIKNNNVIEVYDNRKKKVVEIIFFKNSYDLVSNVKWYNFNNVIVREDGYDSRGFLSITSFFGQNGGVSSESIYNIQGEVIINFYYHEISRGGNIENTSIHLIFHNKEKVFFSIQELASFFYDQLVEIDENAIFIADSSYLVDDSLFGMEKQVKIYEFWHNTFSSTNNQHGNLSDVMVKELSSNKISGYILPTVRGSEELRKRIPKKIPVYNATIAINDHKHPINSNFDSDKIIMVSRIDRQKQIDHAVKAFSLIHKKRPTAKLYIYGYILDKKYNNELLMLIKELGLENTIVFEFYTVNKELMYHNAAVMIMTSQNEGWGMVINEALSYGVPVVSYDTNYGPAEIITNNEDGYIVNVDDYHDLAEKVLYILSNKNIRQYFSQSGIENMKRYNIENIANIWKNLSKKLLLGDSEGRSK
ncbi:glycosyltransferase [Fructobacillus cardui]|uniref:Glycosyltransferase involved in cell wall bisynthesis (RfaB) n=1 Tax=Fructobacillus cardui TaxID=2893170 RepID=A0ABN9Z062_9LACO|nr:Glycosyltransferase involved in cell wall bisynthesis (RfaB) [Fructobacillus cardui]